MLRFLLKLTEGRKFGAAGFYPIPTWLRLILNQYHTQRQVAVYSRLVVGADMSVYAPDELGCAESVTRLLRTIDESLVSITTGTWTLMEHLIRSRRFIEIPEYLANDGCVVIAATGTGNGRFPGHVGIKIGKRVYSNNSRSGKWDSAWSVLAFKDYYQRQGGMKVRFFAITD